MERADPVTSDVPDERPPGWRYLEVAYETLDRTQVFIDGVATADGRPVGALIAELGAAGWEMIGSAADPASDAGSAHVLWFRRPEAAEAPVAADPPRTRRAVVLQGIGDARYDPERHARLVATISELTGESGWRATRIVDKAPRVVAEDVSVEEAERIRTALERLGATVEIR